ncbi:hypothetical protein FHG64_15860 [Antarcticibacterium flavum]|uniref:Uncharacterized protein n=1 Tax=Antarcticibacterium flavum TaxID=2058175 RepID=A0A5B7X5T8_9FLAO|nr:MULTISPECIES: hypothetical protein [Antarcticibacterium]MCM4161934.1 hypothetical protein [Antarcticibacterium sp. W02-3]QCY70747.1 hypothetical protein FHG64_15860 [Antarcticibacterium flavum]
MKIKYKNPPLKIYLIVGLLWSIWSLILFVFKEDLHWTDYVWILFAIMFLGSYLYLKQFQYLIIENGFINYYSPFSTKSKKAEIKGVKKFAGDYILKTDKIDFTINTQLIDPDSLAVLNAELTKLNVGWK